MEQINLREHWQATSPSDKKATAAALETSVATLTQYAHGFSSPGTHFLRSWAAYLGAEPQNIILPPRRVTQTPGKPGRKKKAAA